MKSRLLLFLLAFCCECASAQTVDTIRIYFRRGYSTLEPSFRNNQRTLDQLIEHLRAASTGTGRSVSAFRVEGNASPDGAFDANERLGHKRVANTLEYIRSRVTLPDSVVSYKANGIDWDGLAQRVEADPSVPYGDQIVDIIRNTPIWIFDDEGKIIDGRKKQLMDLKGGVPYRYIEEHIFPELRNSTLVLTCTLSEDSDLTEQSESGSPTGINTDTQTNRQDNDPLSSAAQRAAQGGTSAEPASLQATSTDVEPDQRLALKTNLLYDAILMPSLEIEYRFHDRWTVNLEGDMAWWHNDRKHKYYQVATISPEVRWWFGQKENSWHGHYLGLFGGYTWYDLENGKRGYQGEAEMVGLSYGYMFPIGRRLSLEAGIGIGYMHSKYEEYDPVPYMGDTHYVYQKTSRLNYFGPLKLKLALAWRLWNTDKTKGGGK